MKKYYINIALRGILCASLVLLVSIGNSSYAQIDISDIKMMHNLTANHSAKQRLARVKERTARIEERKASLDENTSRLLNFQREQDNLEKIQRNTIIRTRIITIATAVAAMGAALWLPFRLIPQQTIRPIKAASIDVDKEIVKEQVTQKQANRLIYAVVACTLVIALVFLYTLYTT